LFHPSALSNAHRPDEPWQQSTRQVVEKAQEHLWAPAGGRALAYLRSGRGLNDSSKFIVCTVEQRYPSVLRLKCLSIVSTIIPRTSSAFSAYSGIILFDLVWFGGCGDQNLTEPSHFFKMHLTFVIH